MKIKNFVLTVTLILALIIAWHLIRTFSPREIDDMSPGISCDKNLMEKADILWIIPKYNNIPISENKSWCSEIIALNKTLGMHGVKHEYNEFSRDWNEQYLQEGIKIFEDCFNFTPAMFKPPQMEISENSMIMIENNGLKVRGSWNELIHKVYHCGDTGIVSNKWQDLL